MVVPSNMIDNHNGKGGGVMQNRRGLMETSNMFSVYRNSLKTGNGGPSIGGQLLMNQQ